MSDNGASMPSNLSRRGLLGLALAGVAVWTLSPELALAKGKPLGHARTRSPKGEALIELMAMKEGVAHIRITHREKVTHMRGKVGPGWKKAFAGLKVGQPIRAKAGSKEIVGKLTQKADGEAEAEWENGGVTHAAGAAAPLLFLLAVGGLVVVAAYGGELELEVETPAGKAAMKLSTDGAQGANTGKPSGEGDGGGKDGDDDEDPGEEIGGENDDGLEGPGGEPPTGG